jgi:hypothetical protein
MIEWFFILLFVVGTACWIGYDYKKSKKAVGTPLKCEVVEKRDDDTKVIQRQAVVEEADSKVRRRVEEIAQIKHDTEIIELAGAPPMMSAPSPAPSRRNDPATDTALMKIVTSKVDEAQRLVDKRASDRKIAGGGMAR